MLCQACGHDCAETTTVCPQCGATIRPVSDGSEERTMALDASEFDLPPEDDDSEEKTAAFDPESMGLLDDTPADNVGEQEEKTAAFDPESMGLIETPTPAVNPSEERTAAFDPSMLEDVGRQPAAAPAIQQPPPSKGATDAFNPSHLSGDDSSPSVDLEERTVAMDIPPEFFDDEDEPAPPAPPTPAQAPTAAPELERGSPPVARPSGTPSASPPDTRSAASNQARSSGRVLPPTGRLTPPSLVSSQANNGSPPTPPSGGSSLPLPALIGAGVALILGLGGLLFAMSGDESEGTSKVAESASDDGDSDDESLDNGELDMEIPASAEMLVSAKVSRLWKSWLFEAFEDAVIAELESESEYVTFEELSGVKLQHLKRIEVGLDPNTEDFAPLILIDLKRLKAEKLKTFLEGEFQAPSVELEGVTFYSEGKHGPLIGIIGAKRLAIGTERDLKGALKGPSWRKNKPLKAAFNLLRGKAAIRAVIPVEGPLTEEIPLDAIPMGKAVKQGDLLAVSLDADDALVIELAYVATGDDSAKRLDTIHTELKGTLEMVKAERKNLIKEVGGDVPPVAIKAANAALDSIALERNDDHVFLTLKLPRADLEPVVALAKQMLPPAPPKAKVRSNRKKTKADESDDGDDDE
ncbi:MAG: hypothetical protein ACPGU1_06705 [Myxococcota bacterium]